MIKLTQRAERQHSYDKETRFNQRGEVQHWASARNNLVQVPLDVLDGINPTNNLFEAGRQLDEVFETGGIGEFLAVLGAPWLILIAIVQEVAEFVFMPFFIVKDLLDAGIHSTQAITNGRDEGSEQRFVPRGSNKKLFTPTIEVSGPAPAPPRLASSKIQ